MWRRIRSVNCADADKVLCAISSAGGLQSGETRGAVAQSILLFLLLECQDLCVVSPPGWSWGEEEWEARREKVEEERGKVGRGKKKVAGARRE